MSDTARAKRIEPRVQLTVGLNPELRAALEVRAKSEHRSLSAQVHHWIVLALKSEPRRGGVAT
jgi:hypothetical protein